MNFKICKWAILPITMKRSTSIFHCTVFGNTLERDDNHEYLGASTSHDPRLKKHCNEITKGPIKLLNCYVALYRHVPKKCTVELIRPKCAHNFNILDKLGILRKLLLLIVLYISSVQLPVLIAMTIDAQHRSERKMPLRGRIIYRRCQWPKLLNILYSSNRLWWQRGRCRNCCFSVPAISK